MAGYMAWIVSGGVVLAEEVVILHLYEVARTREEAESSAAFKLEKVGITVPALEALPLFPVRPFVP